MEHVEHVLSEKMLQIVIAGFAFIYIFSHKAHQEVCVLFSGFCKNAESRCQAK